MTNAYMHEFAEQAINRTVFITGHSRSGTTILGKIIHSFKNVEYAFEPPLLSSLFPLIEGMPENQFRLLLETYCFEELLLGQITGRTVNLNLNDDSCILHSKTQEEINQRMQKAWNKKNTIDVANRKRLVIKILDVVEFFVQLEKYYPGIKVIMTHRRANAVIESVLKKHWFSDETLKAKIQVWPSQTKEELVIPMWVEKNHIQDWKRWNELERAAYYFSQLCTKASKIKNLIYFSYELFLQDPEKVITDLSQHLSMEFGKMTDSLLAQVSSRSSVTENWIAKLSSELKNLVLEHDEKAFI